MKKEDIVNQVAPPDQIMRLATESDAGAQAVYAVNYVIDYSMIKDSVVSVLYNPALRCYHFVIHYPDEMMIDGDQTIHDYVKQYDLRLVRQVAVKRMRIPLTQRLWIKCTAVGQTFTTFLRRISEKLSK